jgi:hypothetical protein
VGAGASRRAEDRAAWADRGLATARLHEESTSGQHELQLPPAVPMERHARSRIDLDDATVEIRASDRIINDETDPRAGERVGPCAPR